MQLERMDNEKVYSQLVTIMILYGEHHMKLHHNTTPEKAVREVSNKDSEACFALSPPNCLDLAKDLIDAAYHCKVKKKESKKSRQ